MSSRPRIAVWYLVFPAAMLVFGLLLGGSSRASNPVSPREQALQATVTALQTQPTLTPARVEVTRVVEKVVEKSVDRLVEVTRIVPSKPALVEVTRVIEKPVEVTRVIEVVVTATPRPATAPTPSTAPKPTAIPADRVLRFEELWVGQGMNIRTWDFPRKFRDKVLISFYVENRTGATLNLETRPRVYLEFNTGKRYEADDVFLAYNDWKSGSDETILNVIFGGLSWDDFQAAKRNNEVLFYTVVVEGFHPRLPEARWREEIMH